VPLVYHDNAGSTGLNLQAANTVINVDLPWNPAVLEQRIGRAHRMGQKQPVQVYVLVTEETLEESLLGTLSAKHDLALAALDAESDVTQVDFKSGVEELRRRLEVLLGAKPKRRLTLRNAKRFITKRSRSSSIVIAWRPLAARCWERCSVSSASWFPKTDRSRQQSRSCRK